VQRRTSGQRVASSSTESIAFSLAATAFALTVLTIIFHTWWLLWAACWLVLVVTGVKLYRHSSNGLSMGLTRAIGESVLDIITWAAKLLWEALKIMMRPRRRWW